jgi:hypothetical protein
MVRCRDRFRVAPAEPPYESTPSGALSCRLPTRFQGFEWKRPRTAIWVSFGRLAVHDLRPGFVEKNASNDDAPVLICSDLPEADHMRMPAGSAIEESGILAPLSYYRLTVPVVPLPRTRNDETMRAGSQFLQQAINERFLALAFVESYATLDWLEKSAAATHYVRELGVFCGVKGS